MNQVDNSKYSNAAHNVGASKFKLLLWYFTNVIFFINPFNPFSFLKIALLKLFGAKIGTGVLIKPAVNIKYPWKLIIGDFTWIGERVWIDNLEDIIIGKNVCISQNAMLLTGSHDHTKIDFPYNSGGIVIEDGVWVGAKSIVAKGVTCKSHSILSINSVTEKDLEPYIIYKGNPARAVLKRKIS